MTKVSRLGLGFSCAAIQKRRPRRHVVVECDAGVRARMPAKLEVVAATWQAYLSRPFSAAGTVVFDREDDRGYLALDAGPFSAVFFDDFPIVATPSRGSRWRTFLEAVRPLLTKDARIVGYCCDAVRLRKALPDKFALFNTTNTAKTSGLWQRRALSWAVGAWRRRIVCGRRLASVVEFVWRRHRGRGLRSCHRWRRFRCLRHCDWRVRYPKGCRRRAA